jgi:hypothetical protein
MSLWSTCDANARVLVRSSVGIVIFGRYCVLITSGIVLNEQNQCHSYRQDEEKAQFCLERLEFRIDTIRVSDITLLKEEHSFGHT